METEITGMTHDKKSEGPKFTLDIEGTLKPWDDDTITTATATVTPAYDAVTNPNGVQITATSIQNPDVKVWALGGVSGQTYKVTVTAYTANGRIKEVDFQLRVKDD